MAHNCIEVTSASPCPICGKPNWCCVSPIKSASGMYFIICKREFDEEDKIGYDGNFYIYDGETSSGNSRYEEAMQRAQRLNEASSNRNWKQSSFKKKEIIMRDELKPRDNEYLDEIYRYMLSLMYLDEIHESYLSKEGWTKELLERNLIRSFPENDYIRYKYNNSFSHNPYRKTIAAKVIEHFKPKYGEDCLRGVPGAFKNGKGEWTFSGPKGILFPMYDAKGNLYRLRIRMDYMDIEQKLVQKKNEVPYYELDNEIYYLVPMKGIYQIIDGEKVFVNDKAFKKKRRGKYRNFSSYHLNDDMLKEGIGVNDFDSGCEAGNQLGVYTNPQRDNMFVCFVTEGEKKAIFTNHKLRAPVIALPGVDSWSKLINGEVGSRDIDILRERGVGMFVVAFDADKKENMAVFKNERKTIDALKKEGFAIGVANWDMVLGKGMDDLLAAGHQPDYELC